MEKVTGKAIRIIYLVVLAVSLLTLISKLVATYSNFEVGVKSEQLTTIQKKQTKSEDSVESIKYRNIKLEQSISANQENSVVPNESLDEQIQTLKNDIKKLKNDKTLLTTYNTDQQILAAQKQAFSDDTNQGSEVIRKPKEHLYTVKSGDSPDEYRDYYLVGPWAMIVDKGRWGISRKLPIVYIDPGIGGGGSGEMNLKKIGSLKE